MCVSDNNNNNKYVLIFKFVCPRDGQKQIVLFLQHAAQFHTLLSGRAHLVPHHQIHGFLAHETLFVGGQSVTPVFDFDTPLKGSHFFFQIQQQGIVFGTRGTRGGIGREFIKQPLVVFQLVDLGRIDTLEHGLGVLQQSSDRQGLIPGLKFAEGHENFDGVAADETVPKLFAGLLALAIGRFDGTLQGLRHGVQLGLIEADAAVSFDRHRVAATEGRTAPGGMGRIVVGVVVITRRRRSSAVVAILAVGCRVGARIKMNMAVVRVMSSRIRGVLGIAANASVAALVAGVGRMGSRHGGNWRVATRSRAIEIPLVLPSSIVVNPFGPFFPLAVGAVLVALLMR